MTTDVNCQVPALPCAICRVRPQRDKTTGLPHGANIFTSGGHEGATAYDAGLGGEHLELIICTGCLMDIQAGEAIHRVLHPAGEIPGQTVPWLSDEDPGGDNPWNKQRLRNEWALLGYFEGNPGIGESQAKLVYDACQEASRTGAAFDPATVPV